MDAGVSIIASECQGNRWSVNVDAINNYNYWLSTMFVLLLCNYYSRSSHPLQPTMASSSSHSSPTGGGNLFSFSERSLDYQKRLTRFLEEFIYPNEHKIEQYYKDHKRKHPNQWPQVCPIMEDLKIEAKKQGLWNLFCPDAKVISSFLFLLQRRKKIFPFDKSYIHL